MKTILVATDYTKASRQAVEYAATLARLKQSKVVLFNSFELPAEVAYPSGVCPHISKLMDDNKILLNEYANEIAEKFAIEVDWCSTLSFVEEELDRLVKELPADLVVMGMKKEAAEYPFFGSTTTRIIAKGKYPVLVVPEDAVIKEPAKLLLAWESYEPGSENSLQLLKEIATTYKATVEVLHVEKPKEQLVYQAAQEGQFQPGGLEYLLDGISHFYRDITETDVVHGIERSVNEYHADLLVMVPHKKGFWNELFQKSTTRKMAFKTSCPMLCLPARVE